VVDYSLRKQKGSVKHAVVVPAAGIVLLAALVTLTNVYVSKGRPRAFDEGRTFPHTGLDTFTD
jgi:hypothetical protein